LTKEKSQPINPCWRACPLVIYPVCGSNGKTYDNDCELKVASCMRPSIKLVTRARCGNKKVIKLFLFWFYRKSLIRILSFFVTKLGDGKMGALCNRPCPRIKRPVCASNGVTYYNEWENALPAHTLGFSTN